MLNPAKLDNGIFKMCAYPAEFLSYPFINNWNIITDFKILSEISLKRVISFNYWLFYQISDKMFLRI